MELLGPKSVKQLVFFLIDKSGSMISHYCETYNRFNASMKFITKFVEKAQEMHIPSLFGSILFNQKSEVRNELTPFADEFLNHLIIENERPSGGTALFDAIKRAADLLIEATKDNKYPHAILRIIVISDGDDTQSNTTEIASVANFILRHNIRVDSIYLSPEIENKLVYICKMTGCSTICPNNFDEGLEFVSQEPFINPEHRNFGPIRPANVTATELSSLPKYATKDLISDIKSATPSNEEVKQLVFFLIDKSGSMISRYCETYNRFNASMKFITKFVEKAQEMHIPSLFGSILFNQKSEVRNELTPFADEFLNRLIIENERPSGGTALFDAIKRAADLLIEATKDNKYPHAILRIIVISDGDDTQSNTTEIASVANFILRNNIRVDSIYLSPEIENKLVYICKMTGCSTICPNNFDEGLEFVSQEPFINPEHRNFGPIHPANVTATELSSLPKYATKDLIPDIT